MSKSKLVLEVVENLRKLATSIELMTNGMDAEEEALVAKDVITLVEVRAKLAAISQTDKQKEVKALITKFGANKLTDLDPSCYGELLKEASEL